MFTLDHRFMGAYFSMIQYIWQSLWATCNAFFFDIYILSNSTWHLNSCLDISLSQPMRLEFYSDISGSVDLLFLIRVSPVQIFFGEHNLISSDPGGSSV